jgi:hypothetical protein
LRCDLDQDDPHVYLFAKAKKDYRVDYKDDKEGECEPQAANNESEYGETEEDGHREDDKEIDHALGHELNQEYIDKAEHKRNSKTCHDFGCILGDI